MSIELSKPEVKDVVASIQRYFAEELEMELNEMRAKFLLDYFLKEVGPLAYNRGVRDAERFFRERIEDLPGACYEEGLRFWVERDKKKRH
jgi:uncharacterized protein (DUF2164 family)